jgi:hypothetical protein
MLQKTRTFTSSLALLFLLGAIAPASANAWPLGKVFHLHPRAPKGQDARITVHLYNKSDSFQEVSVAGRVYTVLPHYGLAIHAPAGTDVFAGTTTFYHRKGDLLFSVTPDRNASTVTID